MRTLLAVLAAAASSSASAATVDFKAALYLIRCAESACAIIGQQTPAPVQVTLVDGRGTAWLKESSDGIQVSVAVNVHQAGEWLDFQINEFIQSEMTTQIKTLSSFRVDSIQHLPSIDWTGTSVRKDGAELMATIVLQSIDAR
jgi:hypothetical protein